MKEVQYIHECIHSICEAQEIAEVKALGLAPDSESDSDTSSDTEYDFDDARTGIDNTSGSDVFEVPTKDELNSYVTAI